VFVLRFMRQQIEKIPNTQPKRQPTRSSTTLPSRMVEPEWAKSIPGRLSRPLLTLLLAPGRN
jgi:hypothetical protein